MVEPSEKLAEKCASKKITVHTCTFQDFKTSKVFDIIIGISSLIHIPKSDLSSQIARISAFLKPGGLLFVSFLLGKNEGFKDPTKTGKLRYFSKYSEETLDNLILPFF